MMDLRKLRKYSHIASHLLVRQGFVKIVHFFYLPLQLDSNNSSPV